MCGSDRSGLTVSVAYWLPRSARRRPPQSGKSAWLDTYREPAARLIGEAVSSTFAWDRLSVLTDTIGNRLSGTPALDRAIQWAVAEMNKDGLENVHTERVMVPKWVRGSESAEIVEPARHPIGDARAWGQRRHDRRRHPGRSARRPHLRRAGREGGVGARQDRPVQRAVHQLRRDREVPFGRAVARGASRRGRHADPRGRSGRPSHAAHRRAAVRRATRRKSRPPRFPPRTPTACSAWPTAATRSSSA